MVRNISQDILMFLKEKTSIEDIFVSKHEPIFHIFTFANQTQQ